METKTPPDADVEELFNLSLDMLCIAGVDGSFMRVNPAFEHTLGWSTKNVLSNFGKGKVASDADVQYFRSMLEDRDQKEETQTTQLVT